MLLSAEYRLVLSTGHSPYTNALNWQTVRIKISYVKGQESAEKLSDSTPILFQTAMKNKTEKA
jgi:hypothetical protein